MREMPYGQWLAFDADDSVHTHGPSGYDNTTSSGSHGLQPPTPPFIPKPAPKPEVSRPISPPAQKKGMPGWLETLIGWLFVIFLVYLFSLFHKR